ncbi:DUF2243 domain-containing protein [Streptomyces sp. NPDC007100]|uniref:DUF2243 domain-containing protein n=1 Tax=Streptomyces sp. NPDC007100 TaxID=3155602 RepID=UPI003407CDC0
MRSALSGVLTGIGTAAFIDETVFHQLLHWHHFYDRSTTDAGLVSDGLFHAGSWLAMVAGLVLYADVRRRGTLVPMAWWAGLCLGLGGFQLYDGMFQHKVLRIHQIRYGVDLAPYDWTWGGIAVLLLVAGVLLLLRARRSTPRGAAATGRQTASRAR